MLEKIHLYFCAIATIIVTICAIVFTTPLPQAAYNLIVTIITYYIIGSIAKLYLSNTVFKEESAIVPAEPAVPVETADFTEYIPLEFEEEEYEGVEIDDEAQDAGFINSFKERLIEGLNEDSQVYAGDTDD